MKTETTETPVSTQASESLKPWAAPKLEVLTVSLKTLTVGVTGNVDGGGAGTSKS